MQYTGNGNAVFLASHRLMEIVVKEFFFIPIGFLHILMFAVKFLAAWSFKGANGLHLMQASLSVCVAPVHCE